MGNSGYGYYEQDSERVSVCKHQRREGMVGPAARSEEKISSSPISLCWHSLRVTRTFIKTVGNYFFPSKQFIFYAASFWDAKIKKRETVKKGKRKEGKKKKNPCESGQVAPSWAIFAKHESLN